MKKNENGLPYSDNSVTCLNTPRNAPEDLTKKTENSEKKENGRAKEGCSEGRGAQEGAEKRDTASTECDQVPLAYVYSPNQKFCMLYSAEDALKHGTLFENLYKPMEVYGRE